MTTPIYAATLEAHTDAAVDAGDEPLLDQLHRMDERTTPTATDRHQEPSR